MDEKSEKEPEEEKMGDAEVKGPPPVPENSGEESSGSGVFQVILSDAQLFLRRIIGSDFLSGGISAEEKEALEAAGVTGEVSQNYLAWRRAPLWCGVVALGLSVLFGMISHFSGFGSGPGMFSVIVVLLVIAEAGACFLGVMAAIRWADIAKTHQLARLSWLAFFVIPIVLFLIPGGNAALGAAYLMLLIPKLVGVFPGLVRASLSLKGFLPESPMAGWSAVLIAPIYALFFIVALIVTMQAGEILLILSLLALVAAPVFVLLGAKDLVEPCGEADAAAKIGAVRKRVGISNAIGLGAGLIFAIQMMERVGFPEATAVFFGILASVFLLTVVAGDFLIGVLKAAYHSENSLRAGELAESLTGRFAELDAAGLTNLKAGEGDLMRSLKEKMSGSSGGEVEGGEKKKEEE